MENKLERLRNGYIFEDVVQAWKRLGRLVYNDTATDPESLERATGLLYMTRYLTAGATLAMELNDPDYPYFDRWADRSYSWGIDSPDGLYSFACIRGDSTYRIFGNRGTAHQFANEIHSPHFANAPNYVRTGNLGFADIKTDSDGTVEIILSPESPPEDKKFNWIQLSPDAESVCIRQFFYDWESEQKAELSIEKVDAQYPPPYENPEAIVDKAELLIKWLDEAGTFWDEVIRTFMKEPNTVTFLNPQESDWGGHGGLSYGMGSIEIGKNEAKLAYGGNPMNMRTPGHYMEPTLFIDGDNKSTINQEEMFGPIACVIPVKSYEEGLEVANDTIFGLSSGIITQSLSKAADFKKNIKTGVTTVNLPTAGLDYHVPFGGRKASSFGPREQGTYAHEFFTHVKTTYVSPGKI